MSSFVTVVLKSSIGVLISKGRSLAAEKLKDGDVADVKLRQLIVKDMDDIKSKLDGISVKDLAASISFFNDGVVYLGKVLDRELRETDGRGASERNKVTTEVGGATKEIKVNENSVVSLAKEIKILQVVDLNEEATKAIKEAKSRFEDARKKAIEAFSNPNLSTSDRLLAMAIRIMATVFEQVDNPASAIDSLRYCLEELHSMSAVQENFSVTLKKGFKSKFGQDRRNEVISSVCQLNRIIYDLTQEFVEDGGKSKQLFIWPCIEVEGEKIDPLRDARIAEGLREMGMEQYCVQPWSFGQEGEKEEQLEEIKSIAINTKGQFIVRDWSTVKVFHRRGNFLYSFSLPKCDAFSSSVAVDQADNMYIMCYRRKVDDVHVHVFDGQAKSDHLFKTNGKGYVILSMMVDCSGKVLILMTEDRSMVSRERYFSRHEDRKKQELRVDVFAKSGKLFRKLYVLCNSATSCTTCEGRLFVLDKTDSILHSISIESYSNHEKKPIKLKEKANLLGMKFHQPSEHFFILSRGPDPVLRVSMYNKDFECVRTIPLIVDFQMSMYFESMFAVNNDGRFVLQHNDFEKPLVMVI